MHISYRLHIFCACPNWNDIFNLIAMRECLRTKTSNVDSPRFLAKEQVSKEFPVLPDHYETGRCATSRYSMTFHRDNLACISWFIHYVYPFIVIVARVNTPARICSRIDL